METLKKLNRDLIDTINETLKIHSEEHQTYWWRTRTRRFRRCIKTDPISSSKSLNKKSREIYLRDFLFFLFNLCFLS